MNRPSLNCEESHHFASAELIAQYLAGFSKADEILSAQFYFNHKKKGFLRLCQFIFLIWLRNFNAIESVVNDFCRRPPKREMAAVMRAAAAECVLADSEAPKVADSWVEFAKKQCSKSEANFLNAFLRKFQPRFAEILQLPDIPKNFALKYGQPQWLVQRWLEFYKAEKTLEILRVCQKPSEVFFRAAQRTESAKFIEQKKPFFDSPVKGCFYPMKNGCWNDVCDLLETPYFYVQDPSTAVAPALLNPRAGAKYLDLCAAPGGKSRLIADMILENFIAEKQALSPDADRRKIFAETGEKIGTLVSVDFGEKRMKTLCENLSKINFIKCFLIDCNLIAGELSKSLSRAGAPELFDGVFLDAPCSNTGVLRRRPDARLRLKPKDISICAATQAKLLDNAANFVAAGGKLVYSTCSIDREENENNAEIFLAQHPDFKLAEGQTHLPSENADGCGAFLFERVK